MYGINISTNRYIAFLSRMDEYAEASSKGSTEILFPAAGVAVHAGHRFAGDRDEDAKNFWSVNKFTVKETKRWFEPEGNAVHASLTVSDEDRGYRVVFVADGHATIEVAPLQRAGPDRECTAWLEAMFAAISKENSESAF